MKTLIVARGGAEFAARKMILAVRHRGDTPAVLFFGTAEAAGALRDCGSGEIATWDGKALATSPGEAGVAVLERFAREYQPELILFAADSSGREWAPRLAWRLGAGLITECTGWSTGADGKLAFERPVYGGKATATFVSETALSIAVVQAGTLEAPETAAESSAPVRVLDYAIATDPAWPVVAERVVESGTGPSLQDARIVVAGGRGVGGAENFKLLEQLAQTVDAALGASRAAVDEGWVPPSWQVGQTGKSVRADLYFAIGISGASQHIAGLAAAKNVVAINTNGDAPIFNVARLGIVGDYKEVLPPLMGRLKEMLGK